MTNDEVLLFIQQIKKDYPKFDLSADEYQVWHDQLMKIKKEVAELKYEEHKKNGYKTIPPKLEIFIYEPKEETKKRIITEKCNWCGRIFYHEAMNLHEARHRSVDYIKSRTEKYFNKEFTKEKYESLMNMKEDEFQLTYDKFLKVLLKVVTGTEKIAILNSFYAKENPGTRIPIDVCEWWAKENLIEER